MLSGKYEPFSYFPIIKYLGRIQSDRKYNKAMKVIGANKGNFIQNITRYDIRYY